MPPPVAIPEQLKRRLPLVFAAIFAASAALFARNLIQGKIAELEAERQRLMENYPEPVQVVVAGKDLPENTPISIEHLKPAAIPARFLQPYAVRDPNQMIGLVTIAPIAEGEQMLVNKLRRPDQVPQQQQQAGEPTLSNVLPAGTRAVTVAIDPLANVGGFVRPGDKVDVLWDFKQPSPKGEQVFTLTIFQDVPVLAVGNDMSGGAVQPPPEPAQQHVTLALGPQETAMLLFARDHGRVQLSLRPRQESGKVAIVPTNVDTLIQMVYGANGGEPDQPGSGEPPAPPPPKEVEVYRGLNRETVVMPNDNG